ncbi:hypothetical protein [Chamaesiphon sp. VAR_48_metabat_403]|uniref:hypothetical protein n=1 Tax=Chamaesiphon sp. VAR_48_metabat_403 TaxID=2964700 RepID=UPI00286E192F|nr:hypothetical protein [Chamaesiphon sp. VAR_48_metabat_403]
MYELSYLYERWTKLDLSRAKMRLADDRAIDHRMRVATVLFLKTNISSVPCFASPAGESQCSRSAERTDN